MQTFLENANKDLISLELTLKEVDANFDSMCSFFAEDKKSSKVCLVYAFRAEISRVLLLTLLVPFFQTHISSQTKGKYHFQGSC